MVEHRVIKSEGLGFYSSWALEILPRPTSNDMTTNHLSKQEPSITRVCYAIDLLTCSFGFRACYLSLNPFNYEHNRRRGSYRVHNKKITLACKPCSICPICLRNAALGICAICTQTVFHSWSSCTSESLSFWAKRGRYCPSSLGRRKLWWNTNIGAIPFLWSELRFSICK